MSIYAIGDVQGCYDQLQRLLEKIKFNHSEDVLWFAGDLVNRGPQSLAILRLIKSLDSAAISVLGNHDLCLLALANNCLEFKHANHHHLIEVLTASDSHELINWLRNQKIMHSQYGFHLVHAGIYPLWSIGFAQLQARKLEQTLRADNYVDFLKIMYGNQPNKWQENLTINQQLRFTVNSFTRMRFLNNDGSLDFTHTGDIGSNSLTPWFAHHKNRKIIFGHWAALSNINHHNTFAIDTACVWAGKLTALKLDGSYQQVSCRL